MFYFSSKFKRMIYDCIFRIYCIMCFNAICSVSPGAYASFCVYNSCICYELLRCVRKRPQISSAPDGRGERRGYFKFFLIGFQKTDVFNGGDQKMLMAERVLDWRHLLAIFFTIIRGYYQLKPYLRFLFFHLDYNFC